MDEIEVPSHFLCPISMQLMRDPVILATGITYDRENIERWLFSCKNNTCPATKQELLTTDLTPNHTLRRLIQSWCTLNESHGVERIPTPKPPVEKSQISKLINEAKSSPEAQLRCLRRLKSIANGCHSNRKNLEAAGAVEFLASVIKENATAAFCEDALDILCDIEADMNSIMRADHGGEFLNSLTHVLKCGSYQARGFAVLLLKSLYNVADPKHLIGVGTPFFVGSVQVLKDKISQQATKAALKLLVELCPWGRNRIKAVEAGMVPALIEQLLGNTERRPCELMLMVLDQLCQCAEGRAELISHAAGLAIVSKKILRVSHVVSDRGVRILSSISKFSANSRVLQEMLQVGVVAKLCLVIQVESGAKTKERAKEILRLHSRVWRESPCIPPHLRCYYPSS